MTEKDKNESDAILDLGAPYCLVSEENEKSLIKSLSKYQKLNLRHKKTDQMFKFGENTLSKSHKIVAFPVIGEDSLEIVEFYIIKENIPTLIGLNFLRKLGTCIRIKESHNVSQLNIGGKDIPMTYNGSHYTLNLKYLGILLGNQLKISNMIKSNDEKNEIEGTTNDTFLTSKSELTEEDKTLIWKVHKFYGHRHRSKVAKMLQHLKQFNGKMAKIESELSTCDICNQRSRANPKPKVALPRSSDVNQVVSMDLKIFDNSDPCKKHYCGILYLMDEFTKVIKGKVIANKDPATIVDGIHDLWIVGGGLGPGKPSKGFFADNGGEFIGREVVELANAQGISINHTAANAPHMNGSIERNHAVVDSILRKVRDEHPKMKIQDALDTACMCKNSEVNHSGFSPLQILSGINPAFTDAANDSLTVCNDLNPDDRYFHRFQTIRTARAAVREVETEDKIKRILRAKIQPHKSVNWQTGDKIIFMLRNKNGKVTWEKGQIIGVCDKVAFIKYGTNIRRVSVDELRVDHRTGEKDVAESIPRSILKQSEDKSEEELIQEKK